jgi:eukaryotic-like serine/threonine-protein kinase
VGSVNSAVGLFTASTDAIAFREGGDGGVQSTWFNRQGKVLGTVGAPGIMARVAISPDSRTVAVDRRDPQTGVYEIWLHDVSRGTGSRFTFSSANARFPVWSPDGSHIAYSTTRGIFQKAASGVGQDEALDSGPARRSLDWSRDGRYILESRTESKTGGDIWVLPLFGDRKPSRYLNSEFNEFNAKLSPDVKFIAYVSDQTKRNEVYVETFPARGGKWQISTDGGDLPVWSRDGKELFFIGPDRKLMAVEVKSAGNTATFGAPKTLFDVRLPRIVSQGYDVAKDGRFLIPTRLEQSGAAPITVVVNWTAALNR